MASSPKKAKTQSGGASFWPQLSPRPKAFDTSFVLSNFIITSIRAPLLTALLTQLLFPLYIMVQEAFEARGWSERAFFTLFVTAIHEFMYITVNSCFLIFDYTGWFKRYRIGRKPSQEFTRDLLLRTWKEALFGHFIMQPIAFWYLFPIFKSMGSPAWNAPIPPLPSLYVAMLAATLFNRWAFYWAHRILHCKALYKHIHKQHHMYTGTTGFAAEFASPIEQIFANHFPTIGLALVTGFHPHVLGVWLMYRLEQTYESHSGYCFYGSFLHKIGLTHSYATAFHDAHHTQNSGNFGGMVEDHLFSTMDSWLARGGITGYLREMKQLGER